jgi:hypothetical protein
MSGVVGDEVVVPWQPGNFKKAVLLPAVVTVAPHEAEMVSMSKTGQMIYRWSVKLTKDKIPNSHGKVAAAGLLLIAWRTSRW